jgi:recombination protein RecA
MSGPSVSSVLADIQKKSGLKIGSFDDVVSGVKVITTGNIAIDYVTSVGGIPMGRITELYGLPGSGKTTTALQAAARLQKKIIQSGEEEYILYLDYEHALDLNYSKALGLDTNHPSFLLVQPAWLEEGAEAALRLIETGQVRMSIWDSVAGMTPKALQDGDFDQRTSAMNRARLLAGLFQRLNASLYDNNSCGVFLNHLMEEVAMTGARPGMPPKVTTPGGKSLKYYASLRLEYRQVKVIKGDVFDRLTGETVARSVATQVKVKAVKNKVGNPFREAEVRVRYGHGFDNFWSSLQVLISYGKVKNTGGYYYFDDPDLVTDEMESLGSGRRYVRGEGSILDFADAHVIWRSTIITTATRLVDSGADVPARSKDPVTSLVGDGDADLLTVDES